MIAINFSSRRIDFKHKEFTSAQRLRIQEAVEKGAKEFVKVAVTNIPVYSGMARAALSVMASELGQPIAIRATSTAIKKYGKRGVARRKAKGRQMSNFQMGWNGNRYTFQFDSDVLHLEYNDKVPSKLKLKNPTPWRAFEKGRIAAKAVMEQYIKQTRIHIKDYIKFRGWVRHTRLH